MRNGSLKLILNFSHEQGLIVYRKYSRRKSFSEKVEMQIVEVQIRVVDPMRNLDNISVFSVNPI